MSWLFSTINEANLEVLLQSPSFCGVADCDGELFGWSLPPSNKEKRRWSVILFFGYLSQTCYAGCVGFNVINKRTSACTIDFLSWRYASCAPFYFVKLCCCSRFFFIDEQHNDLFPFILCTRILGEGSYFIMLCYGRINKIGVAIARSLSSRRRKRFGHARRHQ